MERSVNTPAGITIGKDGYLFLTGGNHDVIKLFTGESPPDERSPNIYANNIINRQRFCSARDITYKSVVFPEKLQALREYHDIEVESVYEKHYIPALERNSISNQSYPLEPIKNVLGFFKTDTHLNLAGMVAATKSILKDTLISNNDIESYIRAINQCAQRGAFCGDLGRKFEPKIEETAERGRPCGKQTILNNGMQSGNDGLMILAENPEALHDVKLLIFGDSFFRQLIPHLGYFFKNIIFLRTRYFHSDIVKSVSPSIVFSGLAERYLSRCYSDEYANNFFAYPYLKARSIDPSEQFSKMFTALFSQHG